MSSHAANLRSFSLRLVNTSDAVAPRAGKVDRAARHTLTVRQPVIDVGHISIAAEDPRWLLARRVGEQLRGGQAAILPPEARDQLNVIGSRLGLRAFDISLVIAIVQDHARHSTDQHSQVLIARLRMVPSGFKGELRGEVEHEAYSLLIWFGVAVLIAVAMVVAAAGWVLT